MMNMYQWDGRKPTGLIIFDVKIDCTRKNTKVSDGNKCVDPDGSTNAGVASRKCENYTRICSNK